MNQTPNLPDKLHRLLQVGLFLLLIASFGSLTNALREGLTLNTDLLFMLPSDSSTARNREISEHVINNFGTRFIVGVETRSPEDAEAAIELITNRIKQKQQYRIQSFEENLKSFENYAEEIAKLRFNLLSALDRGLLESGKSTQLFDKAQQNLYGFEQEPRWNTLQEDPLNLLGHYLAEKLPSEAGEFTENHLITERLPNHYAFIFLSLTSDTFEMNAHESFLEFFAVLENDLKSKFTNIRLIRSGLNFHVAEASTRTKAEITFIAIGSTIAVIGLFLLAFRSIKPLIFALLSIFVGILSAFATTILIFEQIHLFTLVYGASLIGVAVDYSLHHIILLDPERNTDDGKISAHNLRSASFLGMISTVIAYSFLTQSSLPGLQQIATFSIIGLASSWLFVAVCYPIYARFYAGHRNTASNRWITTASMAPHHFWGVMSQPVKFSLLAALLSGCVLVIGFYLTPSSTASVLHQPSPELIKNEILVQDILKGISPNQYFMVQAQSVTELLEIEEKLALQLKQLIQAGALENFEMLGNYFPSETRQHHNYNLLKSVYGESGVAYSLLTEIGVGPEIQRDLSSRYINARGKTILPAQIERLASDTLPHIWLKAEADQVTSIVYLRKVNDKAVLEVLANKMPSITFVDKVEQLNSTITQQYERASQLLLFSIPVICLLLILWHRRLTAGIITFVPIASGICTLAIIAALQMEITLFHIFGLYLVLGLGLDYAIFVYHAANSWKDCFRTIFLSSATSCASFGLLSLSSTPMISAFGLTIFIGSIGNAIFSPLLLHLKPAETT